MGTRWAASVFWGMPIVVVIAAEALQTRLILSGPCHWRGRIIEVREGQLGLIGRDDLPNWLVGVRDENRSIGKTPLLTGTFRAGKLRLPVLLRFRGSTVGSRALPLLASPERGGSSASPATPAVIAGDDRHGVLAAAA
jgi:hypothetical protein